GGVYPHTTSLHWPDGGMAGPAAAAGEATASGVRNETTTKRTSETRRTRLAFISIDLRKK
ncbi:MAG: hypothetical protein KDH90_24950, partial [Anaerolineae bacterium]|nr:hypothetical protein [Anaerolineae bacterium]